MTATIRKTDQQNVSAKTRNGAEMPSVLIEVRRQYTKEQEVELMEAVHMALRETLKIVPGDKNVRLIVHEPHRFAHPPARERPEYYTHISIDAFSGLSLDAKQNLCKAIVNNLESFDIPKDHVEILLREIPKENWNMVHPSGFLGQ